MRKNTCGVRLAAWLPAASERDQSVCGFSPQTKRGSIRSPFSAVFPALRGAVEPSGTRRGCGNAPGLSTGDMWEDAIALECRPEPDSTTRRSCRRWPIDARRIGFRYLGRLRTPATSTWLPVAEGSCCRRLVNEPARIGLPLRRNVRRPTELGDKKAIDRVWRFGCMSPRECWFPARAPFRCILGRPTAL